jgi:hypothetical protein
MALAWRLFAKEMRLKTPPGVQPAASVARIGAREVLRKECRIRRIPCGVESAQSGDREHEAVFYIWQRVRIFAA